MKSRGLRPPRGSRTPRQRFDEFVFPDPNSGCFIFAGAELGTDGRGEFYVGTFEGKRRMVASHRFAWEGAYGPIPEGLCVLHKCDTPCCVNPDHLFLGTQLDNIEDMARKGRGRRSPQGLPFGARRDPRKRGFYAMVCIRGVRRRLGTFSTPEEASAAALAEKRRILG
jgi:hypothetical protein